MGPGATAEADPQDGRHARAASMIALTFSVGENESISQPGMTQAVVCGVVASMNSVTILRIRSGVPWQASCVVGEFIAHCLPFSSRATRSNHSGHDGSCP